MDSDILNEPFETFLQNDVFECQYCKSSTAGVTHKDLADFAQIPGSLPATRGFFVSSAQNKLGVWANQHSSSKSQTQPSTKAADPVVDGFSTSSTHANPQNSSQRRLKSHTCGAHFNLARRPSLPINDNQVSPNSGDITCQTTNNTHDATAGSSRSTSSTRSTSSHDGNSMGLSKDTTSALGNFNATPAGDSIHSAGLDNDGCIATVQSPAALYSFDSSPSLKPNYPLSPTSPSTNNDTTTGDDENSAAEYWVGYENCFSSASPTSVNKNVNTHNGQTPQPNFDKLSSFDFKPYNNDDTTLSKLGSLGFDNENENGIENEFPSYPNFLALNQEQSTPSKYPELDTNLNILANSADQTEPAGDTTIDMMSPSTSSNFFFEKKGHHHHASSSLRKVDFRDRSNSIKSDYSNDHYLLEPLETVSRKKIKIPVVAPISSSYYRSPSLKPSSASLNDATNTTINGSVGCSRNRAESVGSANSFYGSNSGYYHHHYYHRQDFSRSSSASFSSLNNSPVTDYFEKRQSGYLRKVYSIDEGIDLSSGDFQKLRRKLRPSHSSHSISCRNDDYCFPGSANNGGSNMTNDNNGSSNSANNNNNSKCQNCTSRHLSFPTNIAPKTQRSMPSLQAPSSSPSSSSKHKRISSSSLHKNILFFEKMQQEAAALGNCSFPKPTVFPFYSSSSTCASASASPLAQPIPSLSPAPPIPSLSPLGDDADLKSQLQEQEQQGLDKENLDTVVTDQKSSHAQRTEVFGGTLVARQKTNNSQFPKNDTSSYDNGFDNNDEGNGNHESVSFLEEGISKSNALGQMLVS